MLVRRLARDGRWLLTASSRGAKIGWQLYVMRPDGTEQRRITEGGNPFYARFAPDGSRVIYTDNARGDQSGIWIVNVDGTNSRRILRKRPSSGQPKRNKLSVSSFLAAIALVEP